jgi:cystathionine beta-lyase
MDFPIAEPIMAVLRDSVECQAFGYPLTEEYTRFRAVTGEWLRSGGHPARDEHVFMLSDVMKGMSLAVEHFTASDTPVAVITPTYSAFFDAMLVARRPIVEVPMTFGSGGCCL